jgi:ubiquinone/menaquinone biosynthesis C-methylase UbiE
MTTTTTANTETGPATRDPWSTIGQLDEETVAALAERLEVRASDPRQHLLWAEFLARAAFPPGSRVLEVGCGTGVITAMIADLDGVSEVVGIDPAPGLVTRARERRPDLTFDVGDGQALPYPDASFDGLVFATTLCHVPDPGLALSEARRVLRPGGTLLVYEGDYNTATVGLDPHDPLQSCVAAGVARMVNDPWIVRRMAPLVGAAGFEVGELCSHGYIEVSAAYVPTLVAAGVAALTQTGTITPTLAEALQREADDRATAGRFFGHIAYASLTATRSR